MSNNTNTHVFWHAGLASNAPAPHWLQPHQAQAKENLGANGLPTQKDEAWRYSKLSQLHKLEVQLPNTVPNIHADTQGAHMVFIDGQFCEQRSNISDISGVQLIPLSHALADNHPLLAHHFNQAVFTEKHAYHALNTLYLKDGYLLHISADCALEQSIEIHFIASNQQSTPIAWHCRNIVVAERGSQARIIERHLSDSQSDTAYINNTISEIFCQQNAHIEHYLVQTEASNAYRIGGVYCQQQRDSNFRNHNLSLGKAFARNDIHTNLIGQGAHCELNGLIYGSDTSHTDNYTTVQHSVPHCTSDQWYKSILDDSSRGVFRARIIVAEDAQKTDAQQQNNNILLSNDAEADSKPELEIYADDVQCSHGATVGQLDEASLFYLQSRGIDKAQAKALLTHAFANQVIERMQDPDIHTLCQNTLAGGLKDD